KLKGRGMSRSRNTNRLAKKIDFLKKSTRTSKLPAVRNNRFFILDYNEGISGPRNIDGLEKFAAYLRSPAG
ncbi:hypothetical protein AB0P45_37180, partial [Streptomyces niveus]